MNLETTVKEALGRRAQDVDGGPEKWPRLRDDLERRRGRRVVMNGTLALVIALTLGLGVAQIPGALNDPTASFASGEASTFRYKSTSSYVHEGGTIEFVMDGEVDLASGRMRILGSGSFGGFFPGEGPPGDAENEMIFDGEEGALYMRLQAGEDAPPWIVFRGPEATTAGWSGLGFSPWADPVGYFDRMQRSAKRVRELERIEVRGVPATLYRIVIDEDAAIDAASRDERPLLRRLFREMTVEKLEIAIDDHNLPRLVSVVFKGEQDGQVFESSEVMELFDYGARIRIDLPPESEVGEASDHLTGTTSETFECRAVTIGDETMTEGDC